ncbi:MAG: hypothetical protein P4L31_00170 [Candidatus Babeliales bacterium]|nr:hypothetical protein [Candidatus Babeliales bacterium]
MKYIKKTSMILLWSFSIAQASAPAPEIKTIARSIMLGNTWRYYRPQHDTQIKQCIDQKTGKVFELNEIDVICEVKIVDQNNPSDKSTLLPTMLPISLLKDKKEGESFLLKCIQTDHLNEIQLTCKQLSIASHMPFDAYFKFRASSFNSWPKFWPDNDQPWIVDGTRLCPYKIIEPNAEQDSFLQTLLKKGILIPNPLPTQTTTQRGTHLRPQYIHGPNGFKLSSLTQADTK